MNATSDGSSNAAQSAQPVIPQKPEGSFLQRLFGKSQNAASEPVTEVNAPTSQDAQTMMVNLRKTWDLRIEDVAVPRADIASLQDTSSLEETVTVFRESTMTRLPVFSDTLDNPIGLIHLKDLALRFGFDGESDDFDIRAILRPLLYAPPSMPMGVLLQKMQTERTHMALVIDEYGGVDGLVTIEDLVEQIVGEIEDEHDISEGDLWVEEGPGVYLCQARAALEDFEAAAGVDLLSDELDEDVDTLGGLVFMLAGRVPIRGEIVPHPMGHEFEVVGADPRTVKSVRIRLTSALDKAAE